MSEQRPADDADPANDEVIRTGVSEIDEALEEIGGLSDRPVADHLDTFERAQNTLRRTLDVAPGAAGDAG